MSATLEQAIFEDNEVQHQWIEMLRSQGVKMATPFNKTYQHTFLYNNGPGIQHTAIRSGSHFADEVQLGSTIVLGDPDGWQYGIAQRCFAHVLTERQHYDYLPKYPGIYFTWNADKKARIRLLFPIGEPSVLDLTVKLCVVMSTGQVYPLSKWEEFLLVLGLLSPEKIEKKHGIKFKTKE